MTRNTGMTMRLLRVVSESLVMMSCLISYTVKLELK